MSEDQRPAWQAWLRSQYADVAAFVVTSDPPGRHEIAYAVLDVIDEHHVQMRIVYSKVDGEQKPLTRHLCSTCCDDRCFEDPDGMRTGPGHVQEVPDCCATLTALAAPWREEVGFPAELAVALAGEWRRWSE